MRPFVHHEEVDLAREGGGTFWTYDFPLEWPPEATRVAVTIEELKTGTRGTAATDLPSPERVTAPPALTAPSIASGELPLRVALVKVVRQGSSVSATIHAVVDAAQAQGALAGRKGRVRIQVITRLPSNPRVVLRDSEGAAPADADEWTWDIPLTWSADTLRMTITAEEMVTGMKASVTLDPSSWK
jgi:hypothetical protein